MDNPKTDSYYIKKIHNDLTFICLHMNGVKIEELESNEILLDSMMFRLILKHQENLQMNTRKEMISFHGMPYMGYVIE